jgi:two-component system, cell cycle sensor histidine kinase and response regulator CckA
MWPARLAQTVEKWWEDLGRQTREKVVLTFTLIYLAVGVTWILFTDELVYEVAATPERLTFLQSFKDAIFVGLTSLLFYFMLLRTARGQRVAGRRPRTEGDPRAWMETASDAILVLDRQGRFLDANARASEMLGYAAAELVRMDMHDLISPEDLERAPLQVEELTAGRAVRLERRFRRKDGSFFPVETSATALRDGRILAIVHDVTERKATEEALRRSEERFRAFVEQSSEGIWCVELPEPLDTRLPEEQQADSILAHGFISECNLVMARMSGFASVEELRGKPLSTLLAPQDRRNREYLLAFVLAGYRLSDAESEERDRLGRAKVFLNNLVGVVENGRLMRAWGTQRDVTERRRLEDHLRQAQRMEAMGRLAGGVAHDFNNLLTAILGYADIARKRLEPQSTLRAPLEEISKAADRSAQLTRQLLAFSRKQLVEPRVVDLNEVVADVEAMLLRLIGAGIELVTRLDPNAGRVRMDRGQLEQVIVNLAVNARDAMPGGGRLLIETSTADVSAADHAAPVGAEAGRYVRLSVTDSGCGIAPAVQEAMFEPFFTTKEEGKGTGLGLATVYGIVRQSGGHIAVESAPGRGARFDIYFPRVDRPADAVDAGSVLAQPLGGGETIVLVENEDVVRELVQRVLGSSGYTVLRARSAEDALDLLKAHQGPVDLLVTDMALPGVSGMQLAERAAAARPRLKVLFVSGYPDDGAAHLPLERPAAPFLQKPFTPDLLLRKVREVLESRPA